MLSYVQMQGQNKKVQFIFFVVFVSILIIGQVFIERQYFYLLLSWQVILYLLFFYFYYFKAHIPLQYIVGLAIISRVVSACIMPALSDDVYRFIWDGQLMLQGNNPFLTTPNEYLKNVSVSNVKYEYFSLLHGKINHPQFYTCYPPLMQFAFLIAAYLGKSCIYLNIILLKLVIAIVDIVGVWFLVKILSKLKLNEKLVLLYALNPSVIIEGAGNAHFEVVQVAFMLMSIYFALQKKIWIAALFWGGAIITKLLPLLLLPLWIKYLGFKKGVLFCFIACAFSILTFTPFLSTTALQGFSSSLHLYFQNFEFNASIYYLARQIGWWVMGYNYISFIGPFLMIFFLSIYAYLFLKNNKINSIQFAHLSMIVLSFYYFFATTVHPWYIINIIPFAIIAGFYYPVVWLGMAFLSYNAYSNISFKENYWLCFFEYLIILLFLIYEVYTKKIFSQKIIKKF